MADRFNPLGRTSPLSTLGESGYFKTRSENENDT